MNQEPRTKQKVGVFSYTLSFAVPIMPPPPPKFFFFLNGGAFETPPFCGQFIGSLDPDGQLLMSSDSGQWAVRGNDNNLMQICSESGDGDKLR